VKFPAPFRLSVRPSAAWLAAALCASVLTAQAQLYWDINGNAAGTGASPAGTWSTGTSSWNTSSTGSGGSIVSWTDWSDAVFSAGTNGTGAYNVTVSGVVGISSLTIGEGSPTFNGGTIQCSGTPDFSVASGLTATINSVVDDQYYGGINKVGTGTLVLAGANTFQAPVTVSAGTLTLSNGSALGAATYGNTVASGGTLAFQNNITVAEDNVGLSGTGVGNAGALRNVSGNNTFTGSVTFNADATIGSDSGTLTLSGDFAASKNVTFTGAGNVTLGGGGYGGGNLTQAGTGTVTFNGSTSTSLSGTLNVNSGTVALAKTGGASALSSTTMNVGDGTGVAGTAVLRLDGSNQIDDGVSVVVKADGNFNLNGYTEGLKAFTTLSGSQVTVGSTGAFTIGTNGGGTSSIAGAINVGGGSLSFTGGTNTVTSAGALNLGGGTLAVTLGTNTFAGAVNLNAGTATISGGTNSFTGTTSLGGGTMTFSAGNNTVNGTMNLGGGSLLFSGGTNSLGGTVNNAGTVTLSGGSLALLSSIVLAGELRLQAGTLNLSGYNLTANTLRIIGNSTIDFAGGNSTLSLTNFIIDANVTLTVQNWANAADFFYTQGWTGVAFEASGAAPMNQVVFSGFSASNTHWQGYDKQITPVPEPSTYGALLLAGVGAFAGFRRYRRSRR
jgi:autotransporter-associated beta strand protein